MIHCFNNKGSIIRRCHLLIYLSFTNILLNMRCQSSFHGKIKEIPGIYVDNFVDSDNKKAKAYFLSHYHGDHIQGLHSKELMNVLTQKSTVFIYTTELTAAIINDDKKDPRLMKYVKVLEEGSTLITLPSNQNEMEEYLTVTLIPAGHCIGSTMFLFRTGTKSILFTGDFRVNISDLPKYVPLHNNKDVIQLDTMYVDTTFIHVNYENFPKRSESVENAIFEMKKWISKDRNNAIAINTSAKYGYEFVFNEIFKAMGMKVYVNDEWWKFYKTIPNVVPGVTSVEESTRIHLCRKRTKTSFHDCLKKEYKNYLLVHLSAWKWSMHKSDFNSVYYLTPRRLDVCFATHCSRSELLNFVHYLSPKKVVGFPNIFECSSKLNKRRHSQELEDLKKTRVDRKVSSDVLKLMFNS